MNNEFFVLALVVLLGVGAYGLVLYRLEMRAQRRFFDEHPEYPNPFHRQSPAE